MANKKEEKVKEPKSIVKMDSPLVELEYWRKDFSKPCTSENRNLNEFGCLNKIEKRTKEQEDRREKLVMDLSILNGLENGLIMQNIVVDRRFADTLTKIRNDLMEEHKCKTASELMLADKIVTAYWKSMRYEMYLSRLIEPEREKMVFNEPNIRALKEIHKGIELSNRQFETCLTMLKNLKQPKLNVKVTADNAYVAQNQQVINTDEINPAPKENY